MEAWIALLSRLVGGREWTVVQVSGREGGWTVAQVSGREGGVVG